MIPGIERNPREASAAPREPPVDAGLILVIDESVPIRRKLVEILQKMGTSTGRVIEATTGDEALAAFRQHRPRVVFAEFVGVHPEDGLEIIHEILDIEPATRVVLVTAEPRESAEVRAALRAGVFAYIEKPLRYEKIRGALADLEAEEGGIERFR